MPASTRPLLMTILIALLGSPVVAQSPPPSTATLLTQIAALEQENARLRLAAAACVPPAAISAVPTRGLSLAEASAAAKQIVHEWPATNSVPTEEAAIATLNTRPAARADVADAAGTKDAAQAEAYWRGRLRPLTAQLTTDLLALAPLAARYAELRAKFNDMHTVLQQQLVAPEMFRVQTALRTAQSQVDTDARAIDDLKEEGRRASALPGWFR